MGFSCSSMPTAGFLRSLNSLGELMKVLEGRKQRGIQDALGRAPNGAIPQGDTPLAAGTANQTKLAGRPVEGPLFDLAPAVDKYLKAHLSAISLKVATPTGKTGTPP